MFKQDREDRNWFGFNSKVNLKVMKKSKKKSIEKLTINVPIFRQRIFVASSEADISTIAEFLCIDESELSGTQNHSAEVREYESKDGGEVTQTICFFEQNPDRALVLHECTHAAINLCELYGIPVSKTSSDGNKRGDEAFAYIQSWLYLKVCKKLKVKP